MNASSCSHIFFFRCREYADEALKKSKVLTEVAMETFEQVSAETIKSIVKKKPRL